MKLASVIATLTLGVVALLAPTPTNAELTKASTTYDAMTIRIRQNMNAVAHATLETKNQELIDHLESFVVAIESLLATDEMDFDVYRKQRKGLYDKFTEVVSSSTVNDLVKRVGAITTSESALNDLSLAVYAPAAVSDFFFDVVEAIARTIKDTELIELAKDERAEIESKIKANVNPVWVAVRLHRVLDDIRDLNKTYADQADNTRASLFLSMEEEYGKADLS